jgi:hypothetical protein
VNMRTGFMGTCASAAEVETADVPDFRAVRSTLRRQVTSP